MGALLIVPPSVRTSSGPLLGPSMLAGAAVQAGYEVEVVDLAIEQVNTWGDTHALAQPTGLTGDHDKNVNALKAGEAAFFDSLVGARGDDVRAAQWSFASQNALLERAARTATGLRLRGRLAAMGRPDLIGVSVMFAEQVFPALLLSRYARELWPTVPVVWGGAHVTALAPEIAADPRYGQGINGFVSGYAEGTFVDLLRAAKNGGMWPAEVLRAGSVGGGRAREHHDALPLFGDMSAYGRPTLTLPAQVSRGCSYGQCAFCTYPRVEGAYRRLHMGGLVSTVKLASRLDACVSLKDALIGADLLVEVCEAVRGRARWSGCTKISRRIDRALMARMAAAGCRTLELGVESIVPETQLRIHKKQPLDQLQRMLDASQAVGIRLVLNYMTGFPGEDALRAAEGLEHLRGLAAEAGAHVSHQTFELERRAPMAATMAHVAPWPWASVVTAATDARARGVAA